MSAKHPRQQAIKEIAADDGLNTAYRLSDFMRATRPYLFSDSKIIAEPQLPRAHFEYILDTITTHKKDLQFEYFTR